MPSFRNLYPFQQSDVQFLLERPKELSGKPHRLLANDMGLGKTPTAAVAMVRGGLKTALIICPKPIKETWARQLIDWGAAKREDTLIVEAGYDYVPPTKSIVIVNYELAISDLILKQLLKRTYDVIIVDEAQRLKSLGSKRSALILGGGANSLIARGYYKWLLSGTIAPNRPVELYPMLKTLAPECIKGYTGWEAFGRRYCDGKEIPGLEGAWNFRGASNIEELAEAMKPFMRRRRVSEVYSDLPPVIGHTVYIDCGEFECDETNTPTGTLRRMVGEAKAPFVADYLRDWLDNAGATQKILVFTYHREVNERLRKAFPNTSELVYGGMSAAARETALNRFKNNPGCRELFAQINVMGEGVDDLQHVCNNILFAELDWSAGGIDQAIGRLRRIGQTRPVNVISLVAEGTLDEAINATYWNKKRVLNLLLNSHTTIEEETMSLEQETKRCADALEKLLEHFMRETNKVLEAAVPSKTVGQISDEIKEQKRSPGRPPKAATPAPEAPPPVKGNGGNGGEVLTMEVVQDFARQALNAWGGEEPARIKLREVISANKLATLKDAKESHFHGLVEGFKQLIENPPAEDDLGV